MSETVKDDAGEPGTSPSTVAQSNGSEVPLNKDNVVPIATKEISDVIQFQEPSTSKNYSFKTQIRINILGERKVSQRSIESSDTVSLNLVDENADNSKTKKGALEAEESYATVDACVKEKTTNTTDATVFSRNERTQRVIMVSSEAPPPYENQPPPAYTRTGYQPYPQAVPDASQGGRYHTNLDPSFSGLFAYQDIRHDFIRKVFFIVALQLSLTTGMILLVMFHEPSKRFMLRNIVLFWIMMVLQMVLYITLMCYQSVRRIFPLNFILLLVFTISFSYLSAFSTIFYSTKVILTTAASTALICFVVSILACQTWFDITKWSFILAMASILMMVFGLIVMIVSLVTYSKVLWLVYSGLATVLFSVFLLYDMQCILGGRRQEISPEEYIYAALTLYVDIVLIFLYMLDLVRACS